MYNPDDRELDRLSAAAGENYTPPGSPNWEALERTLDKELPQKKEKRRRGLLWFFLLPGLFIAGAAWWYTRPDAGHGTRPAVSAERPLLPSQKPVLMPNSHAPASNPSNSNPVKNTPATIRSSDKKPSDIAYQPLRTTSGNEKQPGYDAPVRKRKATTGNNTISSRPLVGGSGNSGLNGQTTPGRNNRKPGNSVAAGGDAVAANDDRDKRSEQDPLTDNPSKDDKPVTGVSGAPTVAGVRPATPDTTAAVKAADTTAKDKLAATPPGVIKLKRKNEKAFSIGATGGIDMSTVKFEYGSNMGYNIGLIAGYHFNKNWSVHTGAIYTKKKYKLEGDSYHPPSGTWIANYKIDLVYGYCNMWEIPLVGRYTFNSRTSTHLFASAGISSYFMNQEHYAYDFKRNGTPYTAEWTNNNASKYWFSVLDFSAGIEKPLGRHINVLLEPYAKLPLSGLGAGKIMLSSFGLNATLQYKKKVGK